MTIKELRKEKGLTQGKFAESLGVSQKAISAIECGRLAVSEKLAEKIRKVYGAEIETAEKKIAAATKKAPVIRLEKKAAVPPMDIYIQSPYGGNITPEEVAAKMPQGTKACYVRVDQNLIWWVGRDGSTGAVEIWPDDDRA